MALVLRELHPDRGLERRLAAGAVVGRDAACDVVLADPLVSRQHARLHASPVGAAIEDLGSANGLWVNGAAALGVTPLHPGDVVQLGGTWWQVAAVSPAAGSAPA